VKIVIVDYEVGNILSIRNAIEFLGFKTILSKDKSIIIKATHLILPGVGAFPSAMNKLKQLELVNPINEAINNGSKVLGICLGMQLLFDFSEENEITEGLKLINGGIKKINTNRIPHIGWNNIIDVNKENKILNDITQKDDFYFVHSFSADGMSKNIIKNHTNYQKLKIVSCVNKGNIYGCQFHPEKSGKSGLKIFKNFLTL